MSSPQVDEDEYEERMDRINERVEERFPDGVVTFEAFALDDGLPEDNLDQIAVRGRCVIMHKHDPFFGQGEDYRSPELNDPTWWEILECANKAVGTTGNEHHVFLEGIVESRKKLGGTPVYFLQMGS